MNEINSNDINNTTVNNVNDLNSVNNQNYSANLNSINNANVQNAIPDTNINMQTNTVNFANVQSNTQTNVQMNHNQNSQSIENIQVQNMQTLNNINGGNKEEDDKKENNKKIKTKRNEFKEYKPFLEVFSVLLVITLCIMCFLPICNGDYIEYSKLIAPNPDEIDEEEAQKIKEEAAEKEEELTDTLELQREVTDVVNEFISALKNNAYENAYAKLDSPTYTSEELSFKYNVEYNREYGFFETYLSSYETNISKVTLLEDAATVKMKIKRYDINRLVNKLISEKVQNGENLEEATYEELLFEYEKYLKDEFSSSNVYMKETEIMLGLNKVDGVWKIVNDNDLEGKILNLEFKLLKTVEKDIDQSLNEAVNGK